MLRQFLVGAAASGCNIAIHALVMVAVIRAARFADALATAYQAYRLIAVMIATVTVLMIAHLAEVLVWSLIYAAVDVAPEGADLMYFAFVNYTTLGYGDVTPVKRWSLLGPMTAMNGVLMFGWSTAVIFEVLRMTLLASGEERTQEKSGMAEVDFMRQLAPLDLYQAGRRDRGQPCSRTPDWALEGRIWSVSPRETNMKLSIALSALLIAGFMAATTEPASAVVYCQYVDYPAGCTVRAGVVLRPRPVARAVATPGVGRVGTPTNRGGPVDRVGRR